LLGGTGIAEGDFAHDVNPFFSYDRGVVNNGYFGDFLWFNTDGSLASTGGVVGVPGPPGLTFNWQDMPRIYLPALNFLPPVSPIPNNGAEVMAVDLNFGMAGYTDGPFESDPGMIFNAGRNGLISDAEGSYQIVNGVNTYVPKNTVQATTQDGYPDGTLRSMNFQTDGTLIGNFSNDQKVALAQLAVNQPVNEEGFSQVGNNDFATSANTGAMQVGLAGTNGLGLVRGGSLENSNVDLTNELNNMILAQKGFDSNARMFGTVNNTLQTQANLGLGS
jgi:flagellar hook protein FlgE